MHLDNRRLAATVLAGVGILTLHCDDESPQGKGSDSVGDLPSCRSYSDCESDPCTIAACDSQTRTCIFTAFEGDGDGDPAQVCGGSDCDDDDVAIRGGGSQGPSVEECDYADNDCDGEVDEGIDFSSIEYC